MRRTAARTCQCFALLLFAVMLAACGGDSDDDDMGVENENTPIVETDLTSTQKQTPEREVARIEMLTCEYPAVLIQEQDGTHTCEVPLSLQLTDPAPVDVEVLYRAVDEYICNDEREQALAATRRGDGSNVGIPTLWSSIPFIVDISSTLPDPNGLLDAIAQEAERIQVALGYEVIVVGDVLPLEDSTRATRSLVPDQHIEIRCCDDRGYGTSYPWWRLTLLPTLENDDAAFAGGHARINLIHELYHLLGFVHPGETPGVEMSDDLDLALGDFLHTTSTASDLAKLACIYD